VTRSSPFPRTLQALSTLDTHESGPVVDPGAYFARTDVLRAAVGDSFAEDTRAFNRPEMVRELCGHSGGLTWVRWIVETHSQSI